MLLNKPWLGSSVPTSCPRGPPSVPPFLFFFNVVYFFCRTLNVRYGKSMVGWGFENCFEKKRGHHSTGFITKQFPSSPQISNMNITSYKSIQFSMNSCQIRWVYANLLFLLCFWVKLKKISIINYKTNFSTFPLIQRVDNGLVGNYFRQGL